MGNELVPVVGLHWIYVCFTRYVEQLHMPQRATKHAKYGVQFRQRRQKIGIYANTSAPRFRSIIRPQAARVTDTPPSPQSDPQKVCSAPQANRETPRGIIKSCRTNEPPTFPTAATIAVIPLLMPGIRTSIPGFGAKIIPRVMVPGGKTISKISGLITTLQIMEMAQANPLNRVPPMTCTKPLVPPLDQPPQHQW